MFSDKCGDILQLLCSASCEWTEKSAKESKRRESFYLFNNSAVGWKSMVNDSTHSLLPQPAYLRIIWRICYQIILVTNYNNAKVAMRKARQNLLSHRSTVLKCFEVAHIEHENVKMHISQTERSIVVGVPLGEVVDGKLFLCTKKKSKRKNISVLIIARRR